MPFFGLQLPLRIGWWSKLAIRGCKPLLKISRSVNENCIFHTLLWFFQRKSRKEERSIVPQLNPGSQLYILIILNFNNHLLLKWSYFLGVWNADDIQFLYQRGRHDIKVIVIFTASGIAHGLRILKYWKI